ncbi:AAA family ATPase [Citromicrobium bathyomarinum]|tara:strand:- start:1014 stop:3473 length:2460 start_codon:yes stop_codon:yes gene_type:complete
MREAEFRDWLTAEGYGQGTVSTQLARTRRLDQAYGNLDELGRKDRFEGLRRELSYSSNDKRSGKANPSQLEIDGDLYSNLASYRASLNFYERFASAADSDASEGDRPDREAVLKAIDEFETIGRDAFMSMHDFADRNITYQVAHNDTLYPSKAIFGVAHKYMPGGAARNSKTCNGTEARLHLEKLGFEIVAEDDATEGGENAGQRDADKIRQYVLEEYIQPGIAAGKASVEVLVRDVNSALSLNQAWPNICQALGGRKFRQMTGLGEPRRIGADMSSATIFRFTLRSDESPDMQLPDPTNLILYGPPGTGKTYSTAYEAVRLCDGQAPSDRSELMVRYKELRAERRISFVTFHQSFDYENFVEGLRPETNGDNETASGFRLEAKPGIFREICSLAEQARTQPTKEQASHLDLAGRRFWKMGQGAIGTEDDVYEAALSGGYITLGWGGAIDWSDARFGTMDAIRTEWLRKNPDDQTPSHWTQTHPFRSEMKVGDIVIIPYGNTAFRAVAEVTGDYRFEPSVDGYYAHRRDVRWLLVLDEPLPLDTIVDGNFTMRTLYPLSDKRINLAALRRLLPEDGQGDAATEEPLSQAPDQFVLIIDEINRANISKVFGELITLLEPDKRLGMSNPLTLTLPYSKKTDFGVPSNLHIVGTMNTADRSIALLDTALRRRFTFKEIAPEPAKLKEAASRTGLPLAELLAALNDRVEYLVDREHRIGHAFFMGCSTPSDVDAVMRDKVIPLLQEYFFEDWGRLAAVLGEKESDCGHFLECRKIPDPSGDGEARISWRVCDEFSEDAYAHLLGRKSTSAIAASDYEAAETEV